MPWTDPQVEDGETYYGDDLCTVASTTIARIAIPSWAYKLPIRRCDVSLRDFSRVLTITRLHEMDKAWKRLATFMDELIVRRSQEISSSSVEAKTQGGDVFTRLVAALDEDAKDGLDHQEVVRTRGHPTFELYQQ